MNPEHAALIAAVAFIILMAIRAHVDGQLIKAQREYIALLKEKLSAYIDLEAP